ncbi:hypothetical protein Ancab_009128 [Ancistrocladus abbreviatus]
MECNKDEAIRAKELAEKKFKEKDIGGAKKFALKAQNLYPGLEGISQMMTILDVCTSAEKKVSGEMDWYGILGVSPWADDEAIKKHYKKLALLLHPDKNKSVGADVAFKFVSEAFTNLSDKAKRLAYNQRINIRSFQQGFAAQTGVSAVPPGNMQARQKSQDLTQGSVPAPQPSFKPFLGKVPTQGGASVVPPGKRAYKKKVQTKNQGSAVPARDNGVQGQFSPAASFGRTQSSNSRRASAPSPPSGRERNSFWTICSRCKMQYEYLRRYLNQLLLCPNCKFGFKAVETHPPSNLSMLSEWVTPEQPQNGDNIANPSGAVNERTSAERSSTVFSGSNSGSNACTELSQMELKDILMHKAIREVSKKLQEWKSASEAKAAAKEKQKAKDRERKRQKLVKHADNQSLSEHGDSPSIKSSPSSSAHGTESAAVQSGLMEVPDSDFHDFDLDRTELSFGDDEVWAAYDTDDGMPRFYAFIHEVISVKPFKMQISWLTSKSNIELGPIEWTGCGFTKTCGEFRIGKSLFNQPLNSFSHKVKWSKGPRGTVKIYPAKGDVWALYRNWSPAWNEETPEEVIHDYEMVEVVEDYNEGQGVTAAPLLKAPGFRTVFCRHLDAKDLKWIPKEEMFRFSHQVPSHLLTAEQFLNAPEGSLELDPAAIPEQLL